MNLNELIPNILRFPFGNLTDFLYLCTIIRKTNDNGKASIINGPHGTRTELLPLHPATLCLAQVQDPVARRSWPLGLRQAASTNASAVRSQHDLPTPRAPLKAPFFSTIIKGLQPSSGGRVNPYGQRIMGQGQRDRKLFWFDSKKDENTFIYYIYYNIYNI